MDKQSVCKKIADIIDKELESYLDEQFKNCGCYATDEGRDAIDNAKYNIIEDIRDKVWDGLADYESTCDDNLLVTDDDNDYYNPYRDC